MPSRRPESPTCWSVLSSNYYGVARATQDADLVIDLGDRSIAALMEHLGPEFGLDPQISFDTITGTTKHVINIAEIPFRIGLFRVSSDPHDQERFRRRVPIDTGERVVWLPRAEDVVVTKLFWAQHGRRLKDREDLRDVIAVQRDAID